MTLLVGCGGFVSVGRTDGKPLIEASTSPELVQEAANYGDWIIPDGTKVLLAKRAGERIDRYLLVLEATPEQLASMLAMSNFEQPLEIFTPPMPPRFEHIAGPDLNSSPRISRAEERYTSRSNEHMERSVYVDERTPTLRIVHLDFLGS
ncbi:hypothetical protein [Nocardia sp. GTS18]|uniref:hypothetical protein n=1 Tax=Nocardia sp. GTS18 TaxID=1778064 RepID=UPI0015EF43D0|nr:hypothetical protein [Nocardia sp. GTS18]